MKQIYLLQFSLLHLLKYSKSFLSLILAFILIPNLLVAQTSSPVVKEWDKRFGGSKGEEIRSFIQTSDGGYLLGGWSESDITGDKSSATKGGKDYWIVKVDPDGKKLWDKAYGGSDEDEILSIVQTEDGGYLLSGWSKSGISGDRTEESRGGFDYWLVKISENGEKVWDKVYGGEADDNLTVVVPSSNGGFLLGGKSLSGLNGDKTSVSKGLTDFWIIKISENGEKVWDRSYGGSGEEELSSIIQTVDGSFLLGGWSGSGVSGDKSETSRGNHDFWVLKIGDDGRKIWDKRFGGAEIDRLFSMTLTADGGYLLGGLSTSDAGGDKTENSRGAADYWVIKLNASGNKVWDKRFGGYSSDDLISLTSTLDGGFLLGGASTSGIGGDRTEANWGSYDYWIVKINSEGTKSWDKRYGGTGYDFLDQVMQNINGSFLLGGGSFSGSSGDKTESTRGDWDFWLVKLSDPSAPKISVHPVSNTITGGQSTSFSVEASGNDLSYQWQVSKDGGKSFSKISNGFVYSDVTKATLIVNNAPISMNGYQYRALVSNGAIFSSNAATLTVNLPAFNNTYVWQNVGTVGFSDGATSYSSLAIGSNDTPLLAYMDFSNDYGATVKKLVNTSWETVGSDGFTSAQAQYISLAVDSNNVPYIAFQDAGNEHKVTVMKLNGFDWEVVGKGPVSSNYASNAIIVIDNNNVPFVAYDEFGASVKRFNGADWESVGSPKFSGRDADQLSMAIDVNGIPYIAFADESNSEKATVMKFDGSDWIIVGKAGFTQDTIEAPSLALDANGTPYIAFTDQKNGNNATVMRFNGFTWEPVGKEGFSLQMAGRPNIKLDGAGTPYVSYSSLGVYGANLGANASVTVMRFNGASWEVVGKEGFSGPRVHYPSLALDSKGILYVSSGGWGENDKATVMRFAPASTSPSTISGTINSSTGIPLNDVTVKLSGTTNKQAFTTSSTGTFSFTPTEIGTYSLAAVSRGEDDTMNGISTLDIVQIQRHILGKQLLSSPYKIIASDVNNSGSVTTLDIALIRSLILQNSTSFPGGKMWSFVSSDFSFADPLIPFPYDSTRTYAKASNLSNQDFVGIKLGDVNDSWDVSTARVVSAGNLYFHLQDQQVSPATEVVVPVTVGDFKDVSGYQFTINWDPQVLEYAGISHGEVQADFGTHSTGQGKLTTMWTEANGSSLRLEDGSKLFYVRFKVIGESGTESKVEINSSITKGVAYTGNLRQLNVQAQQATVKVKAAEYKLLQNAPNPFSESGTSIRFSIPQQEQVSISIYNSLGQLVRGYNATYAAGEHELIWDGRNSKGQKLGQGTYIYRMEAGKFSEAKRAIIL